MNNTFYLVVEKNGVFSVQIENIELDYFNEPYIDAESLAKWYLKWLFWRFEYAKAWVDFYNKKIDKKELNNILDSY